MNGKRIIIPIPISDCDFFKKKKKEKKRVVSTYHSYLTSSTLNNDMINQSVSQSINHTFCFVPISSSEKMQYERKYNRLGPARWHKHEYMYMCCDGWHIHTCWSLLLSMIPFFEWTGPGKSKKIVRTLRIWKQTRR